MPHTPGGCAIGAREDGRTVSVDAAAIAGPRLLVAPVTQDADTVLGAF